MIFKKKITVPILGSGLSTEPSSKVGGAANEHNLFRKHLQSFKRQKDVHALFPLILLLGILH